MNDEHTKLDYKNQIGATKDDQHPHSLILKAVWISRVPPEIIFDQGIGDYSWRELLEISKPMKFFGSMEFANE